MSKLKASNITCHGVRERLLLLDDTLRVKYASPSFYEGFKVTPKQTLNRALAELGNGQWNIPALGTLLKELPLDKGRFNDFEMEHDFPGLGSRTMLLSARRAPVDDTVNAILLSIEDVTERRQMEAALAKQRTSFENTLSSISDAVILTERRRLEAELSKQRAAFEATLSNISDAVIVTDTEAQITYMNPTAQLLTGWSQEEAVGSQLGRIFNIVDEHMRQPTESPVSKAVREGALVGLANHTVLITKEGSHVPIDDSAAPIRDKTGSIVGVVLVFHNITQEQRTEQQLHVSEVRYRRLFETAHDGILILDAHTAKVLDVNVFLQKLLGHPAEYFLGKELWEIGFFGDAERSKAAMAKLQQTGSIRYENLPLPDKNGRQIPVEFVSNVYREGDYEVIQCNIRDITERKIIEEEIERIKEAAEMANRAKSEFLANMSHEIRTPMTAILGFLDMMMQPDQDSVDRAECIQTVRRNALHLLELINDILDLSKIEAGRVTVERIHCDLSLLLADLISLMRPRASEKRLGFEVGFDSPIPHAINSDPMRLRQVLVNLLGNAVKFTSVGKIEMRIGIEESGVGNKLCFRIIDTGIGLTAEQLERLFQPFTQAEESTTRKFGGTGLGLTISQQLAHLLDGEIDVKSESGVGSTFTLRMNCGSLADVELLKDMNEAMLPKSVPAETWQDIPLKGLLLLVEDGRDNQRLLSTHLRASGAEVVIAENGKVAVDLAEKNSFDLVLMDMQMPIMDGYTATAELRHKGFIKPIIALTAYAMAEDRKKCMANGCTDYLSKPIERTHLLKIVSKHLGQATPSTPAESSSTVTPPGVPAAVRAAHSIESTLSGKPGMKKIIAEFVDGLPAEVRAMTDLLHRKELDALRRVVHQLRGASGGYGFDPVTEPATKAEDAIKASESLQVITDNVNMLISMLRQIEGFDVSKERPVADAKV